MRLWLKELRESKGYSQQFVADELGVTQLYYCYIESGERQADLALSTVVNLSKVFGVTAEEIIVYEKTNKSKED